MTLPNPTKNLPLNTPLALKWTSTKPNRDIWITPSSAQLEHLDPPMAHSSTTPAPHTHPTAETRISLANNPINNAQHLPLYADGSQNRNGSNGTRLVAVHPHTQQPQPHPQNTSGDRTVGLGTHRDHYRCSRPSKPLLRPICITCLHIQGMGRREWQRTWRTTTAA